MSMTKAHEREIGGHPAGLYVLFFVELWERFSYYGMRAILTLFLATAAVGENPGLGWSNTETLAFYGWYTMLVYVASIPGGLLADKFLGAKKAVMVGGLLLCAGHITLAFPSLTAFYAGLGLIIAGVGCLKPNISTMVGGLYKQGDDRRDKGFYIFYIGINLGAFFGAIAVGAVAKYYGWHWGFGLAGIGMFIGQIVYMFGLKYLEGTGDFIGKGSEKLFHTIGELCASPVALSFITKLAPVKYASLMMGTYFAATGFGNKLAGLLGEWSQSAGEFEIFTGIAVFCTVFGLVVIAMLKPLKRLTHGAEESKISD